MQESSIYRGCLGDNRRNNTHCDFSRLYIPLSLPRMHPTHLGLRPLPQLLKPIPKREYKSDEMTFMLGDKELSKEMAHGSHSQMEFDGIGGTQSEPGAVEFDSIGASLFGELHHRGRVVRVREVTYNTQPAPTIEDPDVKIDFSSMAPLHHTCVSSSPANDPMINIQGTTGMSSAMPAQQWQIQANNTSGMAEEDVHGAITSSYSNAPTCLLQGMAGYDVWSMLPSHLKGISGSCTTRPFEWRNPDEMIWHPEKESDEDRSVAEFDYLNLVRAPSSIYEPIYQGSTVCADPHLKAYNARRMHACGTSGIMHSSDDQSSTSVLVHSSSIILPDYHVLKLSGSDHTGTSMHG